MTTSTRASAVVVVLLAVATTLTGVDAATGQTAAPSTTEAQEQARLTESLRTRSDGEVTIARDETTGAVTFIGTKPDTPLTSPTEAAGGPEASADRFVAEYGRLFGATRSTDLARERVTTRVDGGAAVRYQQFSGGVPVLAGELAVQVDERGDVLSALGELQPGLAVDPTPDISAGRAAAAAVEATAVAHGVDATTLTPSTPERWIYAPDLLGGPALPFDRLVWRLEVTGDAPQGPLREFVLVDAATGGIALQFSQATTALRRKVCDIASTPTAIRFCRRPYTRIEGQDPTGIDEVDRAYDFSGDTYDFYFDRFGRDSFDDAGSPMVSTVRYCPLPRCPFDNAQWVGDQVIYGTGYAISDDTVGHEITHGVTERTSQLLYYYQSGAISESMSDIFGELVDLTNGAGNDVAHRRWFLGEDLARGPSRNMNNPAIGNDPDRMTSEYYATGPGDTGGVHTNSGVGNRAASLLVDGGISNSRPVPALGITKTARIFYEVQTTMLVSGSDYADLGSALIQACINLVGTDDIIPSDCAGVSQAVLATEMFVNPPAAPTATAPTGCGDGLVRTNVFTDDLEDTGSGRWTIASNSPALKWAYPQNPNANFPFNATYATSGTTNFYAANVAAASDTTIARTGDVVLPGGAALLFNHAYETQRNVDGGRVEYSTDRGNTWLDAGPLFSAGGYTGTVNRVGGPAAFTGRSSGYGTSLVDLSSLAGRQFRFRFRFTQNDVISTLGWFVDDVRIISCRPPEARPDAHVRLGNGPWRGDDVINETGADQGRQATVGRLETATFSARIQNDGNITESVAVHASASITPFTVRYFSGSTDVTTAVVDGTYRTAPLDPGAKAKLKIVVEATAAATLGSTSTFLLQIASTADATKKDRVRMTVTREN